jgi:DNA-binding transcriptional ArsR family regulator
MDAEPSMASIGALVGVPARANILSALFDGRALTATELSYVAGVSPQTTSSHLAKLVDARLLVAESNGRHRYYRLAGPEIAEALEPLALIVAHKPVPARGRPRELETLRDARMCYDHLAGRLGVTIADALMRQKQLEPVDRDFRVTSRGTRLFQSLGIDLGRVRAERRVFARQCLDWSERRPHLAGALGCAVATAFLERGWIKRARKGRQVFVSDSGRAAIAQFFSLNTPD